MVRGVEAFTMQNNGRFVTLWIFLRTCINFHHRTLCLSVYNRTNNLQCTHASDCRDYFSRSLFIVGEIGGNDYIAMFNSRLKMTDLRSYASTIVQTIAGTIKVS
jgi:hypothetical protein